MLGQPAATQAEGDRRQRIAVERPDLLVDRHDGGHQVAELVEVSCCSASDSASSGRGMDLDHDPVGADRHAARWPAA